MICNEKVSDGCGLGNVYFAPGELAVNRGVIQLNWWLHVSMTTISAQPQLTAQDRCDQCGAQAYVRVTLNSGVLLFCSHHARRHATALADVALEIVDESDRLTAEV